MRATELLTRDHDEVKRLFQDFETVKGDERRELFERVAAELLVHSSIEKDLLYPALESFDETRPLVEESLEEHRTVENLLAGLRDMDVGDARFVDQFSQLRSEVIHHATEEEQQLFPKAIRLLGDGKLDLMGRQMETQKSALRPGVRQQVRRRA